MFDAHVERVTTALLAGIKAATAEPVALEALWDGDTQGWFLELSVVIREDSNPRAPSYRSRPLSVLSFGSDFRLFNGTVPPWPEAVLAQRVGPLVAEKLRIPFWFPSPNEPDDGCPHWWQQDAAIPCQDCGKPIIPTTSPYLPKEVCYPCHLRRERRRGS
jgi:hypothetical protein